MPRVGGVMQLLSGTLAVPNTTIQSAPYNAQQNDWVLDANAPRPISAGGTGSTTASGARTTLGAMGAGDLAAAATKALVVNTDSVVIIDSQAANVPKRWLVSDIRTAFGPASHDHTKLVSTVADVSVILGGAPGDGSLSINTKADGSGVTKAYLNETGYMYLGNSLDVIGTITASAGITCSTIAVSGSYFISNHATQCVLGTAHGVNGAIYLRPNGYDSGSNQTSIDTSGNMVVGGSLSAAGNVSASGAILGTDGNVTGSIWSNWGSTNAYAAIGARIEARAAAFADSRVSNVVGRKTSEGYNTSAGIQRAPAGAVISGLNLSAGTSKEVIGFYYDYLQIYNQVDGWVTFTG